MPNRNISWFECVVLLLLGAWVPTSLIILNQQQGVVRELRDVNQQLTRANSYAWRSANLCFDDLEMCGTLRAEDELVIDLVSQQKRHVTEKLETTSRALKATKRKLKWTEEALVVLTAAAEQAIAQAEEKSMQAEEEIVKAKETTEDALVVAKLVPTILIGASNVRQDSAHDKFKLFLGDGQETLCPSVEIGNGMAKYSPGCRRNANATLSVYWDDFEKCVMTHNRTPSVERFKDKPVPHEMVQIAGYEFFYYTSCDHTLTEAG